MTEHRTRKRRSDCGSVFTNTLDYGTQLLTLYDIAIDMQRFFSKPPLIINGLLTSTALEKPHTHFCSELDMESIFAELCAANYSNADF